MEPSLTSISWAPDGNQLALTCYSHYVCLADIHQNQMNCGAASSLLTGFSESDAQLLDALNSIDWAPTDVNKLVLNSCNESGCGLYIADLAQKKIQIVGDNDYYRNRPPLSPVWSNDGKKIVFLSGGAIAVINSDGTGMKIVFDEVADFQNLQPNPYFDYICPICVGKGYYAHQLSVGEHIFYSNTALFSWSPDGRFIVFEARPTPWDDTLPTGLFRLDLQTGHIVPILVEFPGRAFMSPDWSP
jgi:Tol biopolymer transport system component